MTIRDAREADLPAIIAIYNAATATRTSTAMLGPVSVGNDEARIPKRVSPALPRSQTLFGNVIVPATPLPRFTKQSFEDRCVPKQSLGTRVREGEGAAENLLFVPDHEMNHPGRIGNPEAVEIFPELFHFIAARDAVDLQIR